jgi:hypothetical protein
MIYEADTQRLKAVSKNFRALPKEFKSNLQKYQRSEASPIWREEMNSRTGYSKLHNTVFRSGTTVKAGAYLTLRAGASKRKLSGGATAEELARPLEFGSNRRNKYTRYSRTSPKGKRHTVTRRAGVQMPPRRRGGYVVYPASKPSVKRIASLHVQTITRTIYESLEKG